MGTSLLIIEIKYLFDDASSTQDCCLAIHNKIGITTYLFSLNKTFFQAF